MDNERTGPAIGRINGDLVTADADNLETEQAEEHVEDAHAELDLEGVDGRVERSSEDIAQENLKEARAQRQIERNDIKRGVGGAEGSQAHVAEAIDRQPDPSFLPAGRDPVRGSFAEAQDQSSARETNTALAL